MFFEIPYTKDSNIVIPKRVSEFEDGPEMRLTFNVIETPAVDHPLASTYDRARSLVKANGFFTVSGWIPKPRTDQLWQRGFVCTSGTDTNSRVMTFWRELEIPDRTDSVGNR